MITKSVKLALAIGAMSLLLPQDGLVQRTESLLNLNRVSTDSAGSEINGDSSHVKISADENFIVFASRASNLVAGDTNGLQDVFIKNLGTGVVERVSVDSSGTQANAESFEPVVSSNGQFVAFHSLATNLIAGDTNNRVDVFVRDRVAGTTTRVSVDSVGTQADGGSAYATIGDDGNLVTFISEATNLVAGDTNAEDDVFLHNRTTGATTRISVDGVGTEGNDASTEAKISGNGEFIAFSSKATNLVVGDTNDCADIFVHEVSTGAVTLVSRHTDTTIGNRISSEPEISQDGQIVAFTSRASNLVAGDTNGYEDIFVHSRIAGTTERASLIGVSQQINMPSKHAAISIDGRFVTFSTLSPIVVAGDTNAEIDVFLRDRQISDTVLLSEDSAGVIGNGESKRAAMSPFGSTIVFESSADNLVAGDTNTSSDIFLLASPNAGAVVSVTSVASVSEETGGSVDFTFTQTNGDGSPLDVKITSALSNATAGEDFTAPATLVQFPMGVNQVIVNVPILDDGEVEIGEFVRLQILPDAAYTILPTQAGASVDIIDADTYTINISTRQQVIREVGEPRLTSTEVVFTRADGNDGDLTVNYAVSGDATPGVGGDYEALSGTVVIPDGSDRASVTVQALDDQEREEYESIIIDITPDAAYTVGSESRVILAVKDNEKWSLPFALIKNFWLKQFLK